MLASHSIIAAQIVTARPRIWRHLHIAATLEVVMQMAMPAGIFRTAVITPTIAHGADFIANAAIFSMRSQSTLSISACIVH
jgi:hypothetical protein